MEHSNSALRAQLGSDLRSLQEALVEFCTHLRQHARDAWVWVPGRLDASAFTDPGANLPRAEILEHIARGIQNIKYEDHQDPHESRICPGIVAVSRGGIALANEVNRVKQSLAEVLRSMEGRTEVDVIDQQTGERGPRPLREVALEAFFFRRLHHWQATRKLEILRESDEHFGTVEYVSFMWANSREVRRTTSSELIAEARAPGARLMSPVDISILEELPEDEPLAWVTPGHTTPKANIRFTAHSSNPPVKKVRGAVLPLVMLGDRLPEALRKLPLAPTPKHFRLSRNDVEIESTPLLSTLPVYRYLERFRLSKRRKASGVRTTT